MPESTEAPDCSNRNDSSSLKMEVKESSTPSTAGSSSTRTLRRGEISPDLCARCSSASPECIVREKLRYCKDCFAATVGQRVRGHITKCPGIPNGANAIVALSGGPSSLLLLHQMGQFHNIEPENSRRQRKFNNLLVCNISLDSILSNVDAEKSKQNSLYYSKLSKEFNMNYIHLNLEDVYLPESQLLSSVDDNIVNDDKEEFCFDPKNPDILIKASFIPQKQTEDNGNIKDSRAIRRRKLRTAIAVAGSRSSQEDLARSLMNQLLIRFAHENKCDAILFGDNNQRVCVRILAEVSRGRGFSIPSIAATQPSWSISGFYDDQNISESILPIESRRKPIALVRPLCELSNKEVDIYHDVISSINADHIDTVSFWTIPSSSQDKAQSIDAATDKFISELIPEFPMTASIVSKTTGKLTYRDLLEASSNGTGTIGKIPVKSIKFNIKRKDKKNKKDEVSFVVPGEECPVCGLPCARGGSAWRESHTVISLDGQKSENDDNKEFRIEDTLCYSCQGILIDSKDTLIKSEKTKLRFKSMKKNNEVIEEDNTVSKLGIPLSETTVNRLFNRMSLLSENESYKETCAENSNKNCCSNSTSCCSSNKLNKEENRKQMYNQISDFLLLE